MYMLFTIFLQLCTYLKPFISNTKWYLMCLGTQLLIRFSLRLAPQLEYSFELNHVCITYQTIIFPPLLAQVLAQQRLKKIAARGGHICEFV